MLRVNKVKFNRIIYKLLNHPKYDAVILFLSFLEEQKIWNKYFELIHYNLDLKTPELINYFFEEKQPVNYLSVFIDNPRYNDLNLMWLKILNTL